MSAHLQTNVHPAANARTLGSSQSDALQNIVASYWDSVLRIGVGSGAIAIDGTTTPNGAAGAGGSGRGFTFDASRVARTSTETRPKNTAVTPVMNS